MFGLVTPNGLKMDPVFLPVGLRMKAKVYLGQVLQHHVLPWIHANFPGDENYVFMQDTAPCHISKSVQKWLADKIKFWAKTIWPPQLPRLKPIGLQLVGVSTVQGQCTPVPKHRCPEDRHQLGVGRHVTQPHQECLCQGQGQG